MMIISLEQNVFKQVLMTCDPFLKVKEELEKNVASCISHFGIFVCQLSVSVFVFSQHTVQVEFL